MSEATPEEDLEAGEGAGIPLCVPDDGSGLLIDDLARLPEKAIVDEKRLATMLRVTTRTIRRMIDRLELPPPVRMRGRSVWFAGLVLSYIEEKAMQSARAASRRAASLGRLSP